ncbi:MAG: hypothetical protein PHD02_00960 [Bacilli bacterium]|nr:hypothetical protein [Bacilli bacterium]
MDSLSLIFKDIKPISHKKNKSIKKDKLVFNDNFLKAKAIFEIIEHFNFMLDKGIRRPVKIDITCKMVGDDATLIVFESILYYMMKKYDFDIKYQIIINGNNLLKKMYKLGNLYEFDNKTIIKDKFISNYENKLQTNLKRYKKICENTIENLEGTFQSILLDDVCNFLKHGGINSKYSEILGETIVEIIGNGLEHSDNDLILDIKICEDETRDDDIKFLNVTVISFTKIKFGSDLKNYLSNENENYNKSNEIVRIAYNKHKDNFTENYNIDNFVMISSFQENVTTRKNSEGTGGRGLTLLINTLIESSIADYCYILSGNSVLNLEKKYLELTEDNLIGFNKGNDYLNEIPDLSIVKNNKNCFNGTIHNLSFILEGEHYEDN